MQKRGHVYLRKEAENLIKQLENKKAENLLKQATRNYKLGYFAEAKLKLDRLINQYPNSVYIDKANQILSEIKLKTAERPYLLTPVANNFFEFRMIMMQLANKAKEEGKDKEKALNCFYIVHDYASSKELKNKAFKNMRVIKKELRNFR